MIPVRTDNTNTVFKGEGCHDLPCTGYTYDDGVTKGIETCWELSAEELEEVIKSRRIFVYVMGSRIQPLFLSVKSEITASEIEQNCQPTPEPGQRASLS